MNRLNRTTSELGISTRLKTVTALLLFAISFCLNFTVSAQTNTNRPTLSNRWLLIVETTKGMKPRSDAAKNLAARLAASGVAGQMRPGDTLGLWTFNEDLYSGKFPLQDWSPDKSQMIARRVFEYLGAQPFEKENRWAKVLPDLKDVISGSDFITVIIISDGTTKIQGTPFDDKINASYTEWQDQQRKAAMPFLTILRAQGGHLTNFVVNTPPFQLELPPLPDELLHPKATETKVAESKPTEPAKPPVYLPPLIISGKKPETSQPVQVVAEVPTNKPTIASNAPATNVETAIRPLPVETSNALETLTSQPVTNRAIIAVNNPPSTPPANPATTGSRNWMLIVAVAVALFFLVMLLLQVRRSRRAAHVSLITRSLDREQK